MSNVADVIEGRFPEEVAGVLARIDELKRETRHDDAELARDLLRTESRRAEPR